MDREQTLTRIGRDLAEVVRPGWEDFVALTEEESLRQFAGYEALYWDEDNRQEPSPDSLVRFEPPSTESLTPLELANWLEDTFRHTGYLQQSLLTTYIRLHPHRQAELALPSKINATLASILNGGTVRLYDYIDRSKSLEPHELKINFPTNWRRLASSLLSTAAQSVASDYPLVLKDGVVEATFDQNEMDTQIDAALQEACNKIIRRERIAVPKSANPSQQLFASSMNVLRTLYHQGNDPAFQREIFNSFLLELYSPESDQNLVFDREYRRRQASLGYSALAGAMSRLIDADFPEYTIDKLEKLMVQRTNHNETLSKVDEEWASWQIACRVVATRSARFFVDQIASGNLRFSQLMRAVALLQKTPEVRPALQRPELLEETLDWEPLPADVQGPRDIPYAPRSPQRSGESSDSDEEKEKQRRIDRLRELGCQWPGAEIKRGKPKEKARRSGRATMRDTYYVLVLPEQRPDGTILEHAVADTPRNKHGFYVLRAELAADRGLTWREIFSQPRGNPVKNLGAFMVMHTDQLDTLMLDRLTAPTGELRRHHQRLMGQRALYAERK